MSTKETRYNKDHPEEDENGNVKKKRRRSNDKGNGSLINQRKRNPKLKWKKPIRIS